MTRKTLATFIIALLAFSVMPAGLASAATGTANLTQGADILPGLNDYVVRVINNQSPALLGGKDINYVRIIFPPNVANPVCPAEEVSGFRCKAETSGAHTLTFRGGSLAPSASLNLPFQGTANRPFDRDQVSAYNVSVSADDGATRSNATGNLTSRVRILEILEGLRVSSPAGAADGTGTAGQAVIYDVPVKNHSRSMVKITPSLGSNGTDKITAPGPEDVAAGGTHTFPFNVTLRDSTSDVTGTFTAGASAPDSSAVARTAAYGIQAPASVVPLLGGFQPRVVKIGDPKITYNFKAQGADKLGTPAITSLSGSLQFACTTTALSTPTSAPAGATKIDLAYAPITICGEDKKHDAVFTFQITDANGFTRTDTRTLTEALTIDNIAPLVNNVKVALPGSQTMAKDADNLTVTFDIDDSTAKIDSVVLQVAGGKTITVPANNITRTSTGGRATVSPKDHGGFGTDNGEFQAVVQASDGAPNSGGGVSSLIKIDNLVPVFNYAEVEKRDIQLQTEQSPRERTVIKVLFEDLNRVQGGCDVPQWKVDEAVVLAVYNNDGTPCDNTNSPDNYRLLVTNNNGSQTYEPNVTYTASPTALSNPAKDGAAQQVADRVVKALNGFIPNAPQIVTFTRNGGTENMVFDADKYWTRFVGNDAVLAVAGASPGYSIEVLDGTGSRLDLVPADGDNDTTIIPIPASGADGDYQRTVRFISHTGRVGKDLALTVAVDRGVPTLTGATKLGADTVEAAFSEKMWRGANFSGNWFVYENNPDQNAVDAGDRARYYYDVDSVSGSQAASRTLKSSQLAGANNGPFGGAAYRFDADFGANSRYEDRAGNVFADTGL